MEQLLRSRITLGKSESFIESSLGSFERKLRQSHCASDGGRKATPPGPSESSPHSLGEGFFHSPHKYQEQRASLQETLDANSTIILIPWFQKADAFIAMQAFHENREITQIAYVL
jgi:hypothetical protein